MHAKREGRTRSTDPWTVADFDKHQQLAGAEELIADMGFCYQSLYSPCALGPVLEVPLLPESSIGNMRCESLGVFACILLLDIQ